MTGPAIAIVGLGVRFPGASTVAEYWTNLVAGRDASSVAPSGRWALSPEVCGGGVHGAPDRVASVRGYFLGDDLANLGAEALAVKAAEDALANGVLARLDPERTKVILGNLALPTGPSSHRNALALPALAVARAFGFAGGAFTLDAACASSLYALALGAEELRSGRVDAVVCGGVSRPDALYTQMGFSQLRALAPDGLCRPLDGRGAGLVVGEGAGVFILKRLADARRVGDDVWGVIRGIGLGNDRSGALLAPDAAGQLAVMRRAYADARWSPWDVDAIEAHATGTPRGDRTEVEGLAALWREAPLHARAVLGSAKGHVGHLLTAAGASSLAKVLLSMRHGLHAPTANFMTPLAALTGAPFDVLGAPREWRAHGARKAGVSGFGFGGINAHLLVDDGSGPEGEPARRSLRRVAITAVKELRHEDAALPQAIRMPPLEAAAMLPQQATMLALAASVLGEGARSTRRGVYLGVALDPATSAYSARWHALARGEAPPTPPLTADGTVGGLASIAASRIAKGLGCDGPSFVIGAGEAAGCVALALARDAVARGEVDEALVGAVGNEGGLALLLRVSDEGDPNECVDAGLAWDDQDSGDPVRRLARQIAGKTAFLYPGSGLDDAAATASLIAAHPALFARLGLARFWYPRPGDPRERMAAQCVHGILMTEVLRAQGIEPDAAIGYSLGESTALLALSAWTDKDAVFHRLMTSPLFASEVHGVRDTVRRHWDLAANEPVSWTNALVRCPAEHVREALAPRAYLCNVNAPGECVIGGDRSAVIATIAMLQAPFIEIKDMPSLHAPPAREAAEMILSFHRHETQHVPNVAFYGGATGAPYTPDSDTAAQAILAHAIGGVDFPAAIERAYRDGVRTFVEVGPGASLTRLVGEILGDRAHTRYAAKVDRPWLDRAACDRFAEGRAADVLGPDFAAVDAFPSRVRLPSGPLMLCHRILSVEGEPRSLGPGRLITEHDVTADAWYLDGGRIPTSVAVEAGQADLFLAGWLGADYHTKGLANYRLLDAVVEFHDRLPGPGRTIRYEIRIDRFFVQSGLLFFHFRFDATVDGKPLLTMRDGCAGFFTPEALAAGRGVVRARLAPPPAADLAASESVDEAALDAIRAEGGLPGGMLRLVHRVPRLEVKGGRLGLGRIIGEADVSPDDWYLTCHFKDDEVMPGTLMYEACNQTLRILLQRLGWTGDLARTGEPVPGRGARLKCRGQVLPTTRCVRYEVEITEAGFGPDAYAIADATLYADDKAIVEISGLSVRHVGLTEMLVPKPARRSPQAGRPSYDSASIRAFAAGQPSEAFGARYEIFDDPAGRRIARLPRDPYLFMDDVTPDSGEPWIMAVGTAATTRWRVRQDAWFFAPAGAGPVVPFAVLLEAVLQPCGWLSAYMGSALTSDEDLSYRNLGGKATLVRLPTATDGVLTTHARCTKVSASGGMVLQSFTFAMHDERGRSVYEGETMFGFFTKAALAQQVGLRDAGRITPVPMTLPFPDKPHLPRAPWRMLDGFASFAHGRAHGVKIIDPGEWFFEAHFFQDPVMPGSLGVEAFLQAASVLADERWPGRGPFTVAPGTTHVWTYRGQVLPTARRVDVVAETTSADDATERLTASGLLVADGLPIYRMEGFTLAPARATISG